MQQLTWLGTSTRQTCNFYDFLLTLYRTLWNEPKLKLRN